MVILMLRSINNLGCRATYALLSEGSCDKLSKAGSGLQPSRSSKSGWLRWRLIGNRVMAKGYKVPLQSDPNALDKL